MTVHKAQGRTIRRLILSLSCHPCSTLQLTWEAFYVAMSRVRRRDDIRILLKQGKDRKDLAYVSDLKKDKNVGYYFCGFRYEDNGSPPRWDRVTWLLRRLMRQRPSQGEKKVKPTLELA